MEKEDMIRPQPPERKTLVRVSVAAIVMAIAGAAVSAPDESKSSGARATKMVKRQTVLPEGDTGSIAGQRVVSLTFKQLGAWSAVNLRGVDASRTLSFSVRADEVVVAAKLRLAYDYSPALIPELSHLRVLLNERTTMLEALPIDKGLANAREINLDPRLFGEVNNLRFNLIGHYTRQCEDPFHSSLWLTLSDLSRIELTLAPVSKTNDLKHLPAPFFDKRDNVQLRLPFVFASTPSFGTLKAAGVLASWFGLQAGARGAQFPVSLNELPEGNAVLFMQGDDNIGGVRGAAGASISIQPHPINPNAKLLVVTGGTDEELARAARAIALINPTLTGQQVSVTKETEAAPRQPYDAPAWVPSDRPVRFGELARLEELRVQGYFPDVVRLNYRVAPDLFTWRTPGAPLQLKYRATRLPLHKNSSLNVNLNNSFIQALALNEPDRNVKEAGRLNLLKAANGAMREESLFLPPYATGGRDQLQLSYYFDVIKDGECRNLPPDNLQAAIDPESTLDFSGFPHYAVLPNLAYFSNIGFPFTRMADLSETAVVLPERPNADELGVYLTLMGRMGEATAYPALRHAVISAADVEKMSDRDLIVIGSATNLSLMTKWAERLPMVYVDGGRRVREPVARWLPNYRWEQQDVQSTRQPQGSLNLLGGGSLTTVMAFESPLKATRSVVLLYADKAADLRKISDVLTDPERVASIQGDFVVVDDKNVEHAKVSETYYLGSLPALSKVRWFFSDQPLLLGLMGLLASILLAALAYRPLRRVIASRAKKSA
jgi:hypothetical protein